MPNAEIKGGEYIIICHINSLQRSYTYMIYRWVLSSETNICYIFVLKQLPKHVMANIRLFLNKLWTSVSTSDVGWSE